MQKAHVDYNVKRIEDLEEIYLDGEAKPLDDIYTVVDVAMKIKEIKENIAFCKEYKNKKIRDINNEIKVLENKESFFRQIILSTIEKTKKKTPINFPGSCSISKSNRKGNWKVTDEDRLSDLLKKENEYDRIFDKVTTYQIDQLELKKMLKDWEKSGKAEELDLSSCLEKGENKTTVIIRYEETEEPKEVSADELVPVKSSVSGDFDSL